jgi:phosphate transport system substrate-binding protein
MVLFLLAACSPPPTIPPPPTPVAVRVLATDLTEPLLLDLAAAYARVSPSVAVVPGRALAPGAGAALAAGEADLALTSMPATGFFATPLAYARLAVVVHPANAVNALSEAQVRALFAGDIGDWAQVGGAAGPVQVVAPAPGGEAEALFTQQVLAGAAPTVSALVAPGWDAMRTLVGDDPNALGYLPAAELSGAVRVLDQPAELRALVVAVAITEPVGPARDFLAWAQSAAGQAVVAERYEPLE